MKKLIISLLLAGFCASPVLAQKKLSKEERGKLTPEQRIVYDNSFRKNKKKIDPVDKKVKRAKKEDRKSKKIKQPKKHKLKKR